MVSIDYTTAPLAVRERFAMAEASCLKAYQEIRKEAPSCGAVILSTCNRTELYLSDTEIPAVDLLCRIRALDPKEYAGYFVHRQGIPVLRHLMEVACGLRSQIIGEDQILTQVRLAAQHAREAGASDAVLETVFRLAVTAGKRARTEYVLSKTPVSAAQHAISAAQTRFGSLQGVPALVIGNGETGRLAATLLVQAGCQTAITLRQYKHADNVIPEGCRAVEYALRFAEAEKVSLLVSATKSPHYTVAYADACAMKRRPRLFLDLAVPRDIDPQIASFPDTEILDIDTLGGGGGADMEALAGCAAIMDKETERFLHWYTVRKNLQQKDGKQNG